MPAASTSRWVTARTVRGPSAPMRTPRARRRCTAVGASSVPRHVEQDDLGLDVGGSTLFGRHPYIGMQIEPLELPDHVPLQVQFRGNVLDTRGAAAPPYVERESFRVTGIVGQPVETLPLHRATAAARDTPQLDLHEDPHTSAGEVAHPAHRAIVGTTVNLPAYSTGCFFERRTSLTMRRWGSPKTPTIVCRGRKPGNRYESERRRRGLEDRGM